MTNQHLVQVRRIYDDPQASDGERVLVDRLWPRGVSKERAHLSDWCKQVAPSTELRKWYDHDPAKFSEFTSRYTSELEAGDQAIAFAHLQELARKGTLTLLTATKQPEISEAQVLADLLVPTSHQN